MVACLPCLAYYRQDPWSHPTHLTVVFYSVSWSSTGPSLSACETSLGPPTLAGNDCLLWLFVIFHSPSCLSAGTVPFPVWPFSVPPRSLWWERLTDLKSPGSLEPFGRLEVLLQKPHWLFLQYIVFIQIYQLSTNSDLYNNIWVVLYKCWVWRSAVYQDFLCNPSLTELAWHLPPCTKASMYQGDFKKGCNPVSCSSSELHQPVWWMPPSPPCCYSSFWLLIL